MYKFVPLTLASLLLLGCGPESTLEDKSSTRTDSLSPGLASATGTVSGDYIPTSYVNVEASIQLERSVDYEWSVRARTTSGEGEWSEGLEFSIHESEEAALADAISSIDSLDYDPSLYSDNLPIPTVITHSPIGSILELEPSFAWDAVFDADAYEMRIINVETGNRVFTEIFSASDVCLNNACELLSTAADPTQSPVEVIGSNNTPNVDTSDNGTDELTTPPEVDLIPEVEVNTPEVDVVPEVEVNTPEVNVVPEVDVVPEVEVNTPEVNVVPEVDIDTPEVEVEPEVETNTPDIEEANPEEPTEQETNQPPQANAAENSEIEALQQSEGLLAFPGALGYAKNSTGGRAGRIIVVNTVDDVVSSSDNVTSLREAIEVESGPRTVVFSVGGVFDTSEQGVNLSGEADSNVTVACQTAPSPGVIVRTYGFNVQNGAHDIIFRHCAVRIIDVGSTRSESGRTFTIRGASRNIMLDHMSFSWATDEGFNVYLDSSQSVGIENISLSNSIIAEGDADSSHRLSAEHASRGYHAMGPSCNNSNPNQSLSNCSIVNNFIAHNSSRNAMIWGGAGELKNNVIYNWYGVGLTVRPHDGSGVAAIIDNNLMKSGPDTNGAKSSPCGAEIYRCAMFLGLNSHGPSRFLIGNNYYIPEDKTFDDAVIINHQNADSPDGQPSFDAATNSPIPVLDMAAVGSRFMSCVGASKPQRDAIDARVIQEFYDGRGSVGIGENIRTGGHNVNTQRMWDVYGPATTHPVGYDTDNDGMPNAWEIAYGLNPDDPSDHSGDLDSDGYTNIEEFLAISADC